MTKAQLKEKYLEWNKKITKAREEDKTLEALKDLCEKYGDGHRWCSWKQCLIAIIQGGDALAVSVALSLYDENIANDAKEEALRDFAKATNNFNI